MTAVAVTNIKPLQTRDDEFSRNYGLSFKEQELFLSLSFEKGSPEADLQKSLALSLAEQFEYGSENTTPDLYKAREYYRKAGSTRDPTFVDRRSFRSTILYVFAVIYTQIRLAILRVYRLFTFFGLTSLPNWIAFFGLSYGVTFLFDLGIIIKHACFPKTEKERQLSFFKRLSLIARKDNRPYRLWNDGVWFLINTLTIIFLFTLGPIAGPIAGAITQLAGFTFDLAHESYWTKHHLSKFDALAAKFKHSSLNPMMNSRIQTSINAARQEMAFTRTRIVFATAMILIGVICLFPPLTFPALSIAGCVLMVVGGCVLTGIGFRIGKYIKDDVLPILKDHWRKKFSPHPEHKLKADPHVKAMYRICAPSPSIPIPEEAPRLSNAGSESAESYSPPAQRPQTTAIEPGSKTKQRSQTIPPRLESTSPLTSPRAKPRRHKSDSHVITKVVAVATEPLNPKPIHLSRISSNEKISLMVRANS